MADLKAAAELMRVAVAEATSGQMILAVKNDSDMSAQVDTVCDSLLLAAQALEALAWAENQKQPIECVLGKWRILGRCPDGYLRMYHADTPLGALLAAMEGERNA